MSYQLTKFFITALIVASCAPAFAANLFTEPVTLRGYQNSHAVFVKTDGNLADIKIKLDRSDAVIAEESFITVSLNGRPLRTIALAEIASSLEISLPQSPAGFHKISIETLLVVEEERCTPSYNQLAWVVLRDDSEIGFEGAEIPKTLKEQLAEVTTLRTERIGFNTSESLEIEIGLERFLTNASVSRATSESEKTTSLIIAKPTDALKKRFEAWLQTETPEYDVALFALDKSLFLVGESQPIARVLSNLHRTSEFCADERSCFWRPAELGDQPTDEDDNNDAAVWKLGDVSPNGWSFSGEDGTAGFQWEKPKTWTVVKQPQMQMEVFQHRPFNLVVYLNDQPIERFSPKTKHANIAVSIPKRFWEEDIWDFRFDFERTDDPDPCTSAQKFAHVSPTAALIVPRKEALYASFGSSFDAGISVMLTTDIDPIRAAQVIVPAFLKRTMITVGTECSQNCIRFVAPTYFEERYAVALLAGRGSSNAPVLDPKNILLAERGGTVWNLHVGENAPVESNRLFLRTDDVVMMSGGAWSTIKGASERTEFLTVAPIYTDKRSVVGESGIATRFINLATVLAIIALIIGSAIYFWRQKDPSESLFE